jgi:hypothetical protein
MIYYTGRKKEHPYLVDVLDLATRLGLDGSVMKKHWSTWLPSTHGSFFTDAFFDLASGITMVVKYRPSFSTFLAHLTRNIGTVSPQ